MKLSKYETSKVTHGLGITLLASIHFVRGCRHTFDLDGKIRRIRFNIKTSFFVFFSSEADKAESAFLILASLVNFF